MITVTRRHYDAYLDLWSLTQEGTIPWTGTYAPEGTSRKVIHGLLVALKEKGAIDWTSSHRDRTFTCHLDPSSFRVLKARKYLLQKARERYEAMHIRDSGLFIAAVKALDLPPFEDEALKPTLRRFIPARPSPAARVLDVVRVTRAA